MEIKSILCDKLWEKTLKLYSYNNGERPKYLCEDCGLVLRTRASLKMHMVSIHEEKVTIHQCNGCNKGYNRLDNMRRHVRSYCKDQVTSHKTVTSEIKDTSPEPARPKGPKILSRKPIWYTKPYYNEPHTSTDYI